MRWPASAWHADGDWARRLPLVAERPGRLATRFRTPPQGAVMVVLLDGESLGTFMLLPGGDWETAEPLPAGPHLLELRLLTSRDVSPGEARLTTNG
ncbi:MAG: hypothetical protein R2991_15145 [Thermoanaerobaculia bacterium]